MVDRDKTRLRIIDSLNPLNERETKGNFMKNFEEQTVGNAVKDLEVVSGNEGKRRVGFININYSVLH